MLQIRESDAYRRKAVGVESYTSKRGSGPRSRLRESDGDLLRSEAREAAVPASLFYFSLLFLDLDAKGLQEFQVLIVDL